MALCPPFSRDLPFGKLIEILDEVSLDYDMGPESSRRKLRSGSALLALGSCRAWSNLGEGSDPFPEKNLSSVFCLHVDPRSPILF